MMTPVAIGGILLMGLLSGWLASLLLFGRGHGLVGNVLVGLMGGVVGGFGFEALDLDLELGLVGMLVVAFAGSLALLSVVGVLRKIAA